MINLIWILVVLLPCSRSVECPSHVWNEDLFVDVNETKILELDVMFSGKSKTVFQNDSNGLDASMGYYRGNTLELERQMHFAHKFDQLIDYSQYLDEEGMDVMQKMVVLGMVKGEYYVSVVEYGRLKGFAQKGKELYLEKVVVNGFQQNYTQCYSVTFLSEQLLLVDCAVEVTPFSIENYFVILQLTNTTTLQRSIQNSNIGQYNAVYQRKIRLTNDDQGINHKSLVRIHQKLDQSHDHQQYLEIFNVDLFNKDHNNTTIVTHIQLNKTIYPSVLQMTQWQLIDIQVTLWDLAILTDDSVVIMPFIHNQTIVYQRLPYNTQCNQSGSAFSILETNDNYRVLVGCGGMILDFYAEFIGIVEKNVVSQDRIVSMTTSDSYVVVKTEKGETVIWDLEWNGKHSKMDGGCDTLGMGVRERVVMVCNGWVVGGEIVKEAIVIAPKRVPETQPIRVSVVNSELECTLGMHVYVNSGESNKLNRVGQTVVRNVTNISSEDLYVGGDSMELVLSEQLSGPDQHFVNGSLNGKAHDISYVDMAVPEYSQQFGEGVLKIVKVSQGRLVVIGEKGSDLLMRECIYMMSYRLVINKLECKSESSLIKNAMVQNGSLQVHYNELTDVLILGYRTTYGNNHFYYYSHQQLHNTTFPTQHEQFRMYDDLLVLYNATDVSIYWLYDLEYLMDTNLQHFSPKCIAFNSPTLIYIITQTAIHTIQLDQDDWMLVQLNQHTIDTPITCHVNHNQLFLISQTTILVYVQTSNSLYLRGQLPTYNFTLSLTNFISSRDALYFHSPNALLQFDTTQSNSLHNSLQRVITNTSTHSTLVAVSLGHIELLLINSTQLLLLSNEKKLILEIPPDVTEEYLSLLNINLTFTNYFNSTLHLAIQEPVLIEQNSLIVIDDAKTPLLKLKSQSTQFHPSELFQGPILNLTVDDLHHLSLINQVHFHNHTQLHSVTDVASDQQFLYLLKNNVLQLLKNNQLHKLDSSITFNANNCTSLHMHHQTYHVLCTNNTFPEMLFFGLHGQTPNHLLIPIQFEHIVKSLLLQGLFIVLHKTALDGYHIHVLNQTGVVFHSILPNYDFVDFDAIYNHNQTSIVLLDADQFLYTIHTTGRRILQGSSQKLKEKLMQHNQLLLTDTKFNAIKLISNDSAVIMTNNALIYQIKLSTLEIQHTFLRYQSFVTYPQSITHIENIIAITYILSHFDSRYATVFYNVSAPQMQIPYFQAITVKNTIDNQFIRHTHQNNFAINTNDELRLGGISNLVKRLLNLAFISRQHSSSMRDTMTLQSTQQILLQKDPLDLLMPHQKFNKQKKPKPKAHSSIYNQIIFLSIQDWLNNPTLVAGLFMVCGLLVFLIAFCVIRSIRRYYLIKRLKSETHQAQEFTSEYL